MKKFVKYKSYIIAFLMLIGVVLLGFGLDFDQTQVGWKVPLATPFIVVGGAMFIAGFVWLVSSSPNK